MASMLRQLATLGKSERKLELPQQSPSGMSLSGGLLTLLYEEALELRYMHARRNASLRNAALVEQSDGAWLALCQTAEAVFGATLARSVAASQDDPVLSFAQQKVQELLRLGPDNLAERELQLLGELSPIASSAAQLI